MYYGLLYSTCIRKQGAPMPYMECNQEVNTTLVILLSILHYYCLGQHFRNKSEVYNYTCFNFKMASIQPCKDKLTPNDAVDVLEQIIEIQNESYLLGLKLKLPEHEVKGIHSMYQEPRSRLLHVLIKASEQDEPGLSWRAIVEALKSAAINAIPLARRIEAKYCHVSLLQPSSVEGPVSQPAIKSPLDLYASYLKDLYKREPFPVHNKWPHVVGKTFINLSLVTRQPFFGCWSHTEVKPQAPKYLDAMFHGKISEVDAKHCMTMSDIARTEDGSVVKGMQRCILVEGAPGVGKSTFAWKVVRKWGKGKILQQYRVMLLLRLREKRIRNVKTEEDLFKLFRPIATKELCESGGEGVFLLLDGWDELPADLRKDSFFFDLLKGQVLPDATVMVTSRPHASELILSECEGRIFQHIQIAGFTEENVHAGEVLEGLKTYITFYPHIASMMCNPLSAAIVVKVYKDSYKENSPIPKTTTELYSSLVRSLLLRYLKEVPDHSKKSRRLRQLSDLPRDVYEKVLKISELAFRGITNNQQVVFDESDLPAGFDTLSILQCVPELYIDEGTVLSYNFLHLTIQEYFAAYHMSLQPTETQVKMFHDHKLATSMKMVLLFFAGLTHFKGISEDDIISLLGFHGYRKKVGTERLFSSRIMSSNDGIRYLFEANTRISVLDALEDVRITLPRTTLFDCYVLGFIVSSTPCSWDVNIFYNVSPKSLFMLAKGTVEQSKQCGTGACKVELELSNWIRTKRQLIDCGSLSTAHPMFLKRLTEQYVFEWQSICHTTPEA